MRVWIRAIQITADPLPHPCFYLSNQLAKILLFLLVSVMTRHFYDGNCLWKHPACVFKCFFSFEKRCIEEIWVIPVQIPRLVFTFYACFMHVLLALRETYNQCCGSGSVCFWASRIRHYFVRIRILPSISQNSTKNLDFYHFVISFYFLSMKTDVNAPSKRYKHKIFASLSATE